MKDESPVVKRVGELLDKYQEILGHFYVRCMTKFEQYDYLIEKMCVQFGMDKDTIMKEAEGVAKKRIAERLKEAQDKQKLFEQIEDFLKE